MWEPFSQRALKSIHAAERETRRRGCCHIDSDALFFGLLDDPECDACRVLLDMGVSLQTLRDGKTPPPIARRTRRGRKPLELDRSVEMRFTPHAQRVFQAAFAEARSLGHCYIATPHLLLAVLSVRAPQALTGLSLQQTREHIRHGSAWQEC